VRLRRLFFVSVLLTSGSRVEGSTVLVLQFNNASPYTDLAWVGESIAETLMSEYGGANQIVFDRNARAQAIRNLGIRSDATLTKASLIRVGQTLDADYLCYGTYDAKLPSPDAPLKESSVSIAAHLIDLKKLHDGPDLSEAGKISELSRLEEHLAWQSLKYLDPTSSLPVEQFLAARKLVRLDAEESYIRGLLSTSREQQQKWFLQACTLDPQFVSPAYELGRLALEKKDYHQALRWLGRITPADPRYTQAQFEMGLATYGAGEFSAAAEHFREVLKSYPLNEVYNNLGAAEFELNRSSAVDEFHHALEGDQNDPVYLFNLGAALLRTNSFDEAAKRLQLVVDHAPNDSEARRLLELANRRQALEGALPLARVKTNFDETAFRQLKAMVQAR
jgi:tetratricopeptide (TPR) repeat protein